MIDRFQLSVLDAINGGLIVLDRDRRVTQWNAWMASASGLSFADVQGKDLAEIYPNVDLGRLAAATRAALQSGVSSLLTHALHPLLFPLRTRSGRPLLHDVTVSAIRTGEEPTTCLIHIVDVTMAVRRERYLRDRQNARYEAVVDSAPDVILTLDGDGVIRFANPAGLKQFGYSAQELVGKHAAFLFDAASAWHPMFRDLLSGEKRHLPVEMPAYRKDGSVTYVEVSAARWQNESRVFVTAILRDVNQRRASEAALRASEEQARAAAFALAELNATLEDRVQERTRQLFQAEEALRQSQKMEAIGQLTGGIAHDFNNLMQGVIGALNIVQKRVAEGRISEMERFVKGALSSANRASALTHRLLAFSRRQPVDPRPVQVNQLIAGMVELLRRSIGEKVEMRVAVAEDLWLVRCDVNQMENALLNLAINARDAMPDGGLLTIATSNKTFDAAQASIRDLKAGDHVCVEISDDGVGMPPDVQARAFDPFFTTKPIGQGTGLGLSMIYGFARQAQGSARIISEWDPLESTCRHASLSIL